MSVVAKATWGRAAPNAATPALARAPLTKSRRPMGLSKPKRCRSCRLSRSFTPAFWHARIGFGRKRVHSYSQPAGPSRRTGAQERPRCEGRANSVEFKHLGLVVRVESGTHYERRLRA